MFGEHHADKLTEAISGAARAWTNAARSIDALAVAKTNEHRLSREDKELLDQLLGKLKSLARRARVVAEGYRKLDEATESK